jgi:hypothetical protein
LFAVKRNCDAADEATNNTTESPVFFCSVNGTSAAAHSQIDEATNNTTESPVSFCPVNGTSAAAHSQIDEATNNTTESPVFFCSVNGTSVAAHSQSLVLLSVFYYVLTAKILSLQTQAVSFVKILQTYRQTEQQPKCHTW